MFVSVILASSTSPLSRRTSAATPTVAQSWARRVNFRYDQPVHASSFGIRISVSISPAPHADSNTPWKNSAAGTVRSPAGPAITSSAPSARITAGKSEAGSQWASDPPIVPRWRTCGSPINPAVCETIGQCSWINGSSWSALYRVSAPIASHSPVSRTYESSAIRPMSTSRDGRAKRSLSNGISECPPASSFASSCEPSSVTACSADSATS